jgi:hypothetical protein
MATIVTGGTYLLEMDTGFGDGFTLDDAQQGILGNTTFVLDGVDQFSEITNNVTSISAFRGKKNVLDSISPGVMTVTAIDTTRAFDPFNESSVYYDETDDTPGLSPLRQIRLSRNGDYLFKGRVIDFTYNYGTAFTKNVPTVTITCADDLFLLANTFLSAFTPSVELSSARVTTILDKAEVGYPAGTRDIETGTVTLGAYPVAEGTSVTTYLRAISDDAEGGRIFVSRTGSLTFDSRLGTTLSSPTVTFSDTGSDTKYASLFVDFSTDQVINRATVERSGGTAQTDTDSASIALYQTQAVVKTGSFLETDAQALAFAEYLLDPNPEPRFSGVEVNFASLTTAQKNAVALLEIGQTVQITRSFSSGSPATITQELAVEGVSHSIDPRQGHRMTIYTSPTTLVFQLLLDDAVYGKLDSTNVLGA